MPGGSGSALYTAALTVLDSDMPQYVHDNTEDELTHDDRLAAARTERVCRPLNPGNDLFMPVLNFFFTEIALAYQHRPKTDYLCPRRRCFQLTDASLVLFKSVFMAAQLFGTGYIFCAMVLKFFQNRVQFSNDGIKFVTQLDTALTASRECMRRVWMSPRRAGACEGEAVDGSWCLVDRHFVLAAASRLSGWPPKSIFN